MTKSLIRLGTRQSPLAMAQTKLTVKALELAFPEMRVEIKPIVTQGDKDRVRSLVSIGGAGVFVKELEQALIEGEIDVAVHSLKDVPSEMDSRLTLAGFLKRANPYDVLIAKNHTLKTLPMGAKVGTGSPRRILQLREQRPDLSFVDLRGNLASRIAKVENKELEAILLGAAGLERLGLLDVVSETFSPDVLTPAIGQGIVGLQCLKKNAEIISILERISDSFTTKAARVERAWMSFLGGGCRAPMGAFLAPVGEMGSAFYAYISDPISKRFYRDVFVQETSIFCESDFEHFGDRFIKKCNDLEIPLPKNVDPHRLMEFWGLL
jgi:hydroxymethylbilane synthase